MRIGRRFAFVHFLAAIGLGAAGLPAQAPIEFGPGAAAALPTAQTGIYSWAADVIGSPQVEALYDSGFSLIIADRYATGGPASVVVPTTGGPESLDTADIDGDGDTDIVLRTGNPLRIVVIKQNAGQFTTTEFAAAWADPVHLADIDGDGFADIVCGGERWMNDGSGSFGAPVAFAVGAASSLDVLAADVDGDGDTDLVSTFIGNSPAGLGYVARVIRQNANATFTLMTGTLIMPNGTAAIAKVFDVNADGRDDLVYCATNANDYHAFGYPPTFNRRTAFGVMTGQTNASLSSTIANTDYLWHGPRAFAVGDLNGDGFADVACPVATYLDGADAIASATAIYAGTSTGALVGAGGRCFAAGTAVLGGAEVVAAFADEDQDGDRDLLLFRTAAGGAYTAPNVPPMPVAPVLRETIGPDLCSALTPGDFLPVTVIDGAGLTPLCGKILTATFQLSSGPPIVTQKIATSETEFSVPLSIANGTAPCALTIATADAVVFSGTLYPYPTYQAAIIGGGGQTTTVNQPFPQPFVCRLTGPGGQPIVGMRVTLLPHFAVGEITPSDHFTDANGDVSFSMHALAAPVTSAVNVSCGGTIVVSVPFTVGDYQLTVTGGGGQSTCPFTPFANPITGILRDALGQPAPGMTVHFDGNGVFSPASPSVVTASDGSFATAVSATGWTGTAPVNVSVTGSGVNTNVAFTTTATTISVVDGEGAVDYAGATIAHPLTVLVQNCVFTPNATVTFTAITAGVLVVTPVVTVDAGGHASCIASFTAGALGQQTIQATSGAASVALHVFARRLRFVSAGTTMIITYTHEHPGMPLALAAEPAALTPSITTPWGLVRTSIIAPGPSLLLLDGLGIYGPIDSSLVTVGAGSFTRVVTLPPPQGLSLILQMYGYDSITPYPRDYIVSNTVTLNL